MKILQDLSDAIGGHRPQAQGGGFEEGLGEGQPRPARGRLSRLELQGPQDGRRRQGPRPAGPGYAN